MGLSAQDSVFHHLQSHSWHVKKREPITQQQSFKVKEDTRFHAECFKYSLEQSDLTDSSSREVLIGEQLKVLE